MNATQKAATLFFRIVGLCIVVLCLRACIALVLFRIYNNITPPGIEIGLEAIDLTIGAAAFAWAGPLGLWLGNIE